MSVPAGRLVACAHGPTGRGSHGPTLPGQNSWTFSASARNGELSPVWMEAAAPLARLPQTAANGNWRPFEAEHRGQVVPVLCRYGLVLLLAAARWVVGGRVAGRCRFGKKTRHRIGTSGGARGAWLEDAGSSWQLGTAPDWVCVVNARSKRLRDQQTLERPSCFLSPFVLSFCGFPEPAASQSVV